MQGGGTAHVWKNDPRETRESKNGHPSNAGGLIRLPSQDKQEIS